MTFNTGNPDTFIQIPLNDTVITLEKSFSFAVVQFIDPQNNYSDKLPDDSDHIANYNRNGELPDQSPTGKGFFAGKHDTVVFSNAELRKGVNIINAQNTLSCGMNVQYYKN